MRSNSSRHAAALLLASLAFAAGVYGATTLTAASSTVVTGATDQLTLAIDPALIPSTALVMWDVYPTIGRISADGLYTAPGRLLRAHDIKVIALVVPGKGVTLPPVAVYAKIRVGPVISLSLTPATSSIGASGSVEFSATVSGSTNQTVFYSLSPVVGTIKAGVYTAPGVITKQQTITVTAKAWADTTKTVSAVITLVP
jgi:hypothetical protein